MVVAYALSNAPPGKALKHFRNVTSDYVALCEQLADEYSVLGRPGAAAAVLRSLPVTKSRSEPPRSR